MDIIENESVKLKVNRNYIINKTHVVCVCKRERDWEIHREKLRETERYKYGGSNRGWKPGANIKWYNMNNPGTENSGQLREHKSG